MTDSPVTLSGAKGLIGFFTLFRMTGFVQNDGVLFRMTDSHVILNFPSRHPERSEGSPLNFSPSIINPTPSSTLNRSAAIQHLKKFVYLCLLIFVDYNCSSDMVSTICEFISCLSEVTSVAF